MEEIEYKLNTKNSVLVVNGIEKLITTVKSKYKPADRQKFVLDNEELKFLREKCSSKETVISLTACQGLLVLVEAGVLEIGHTMSTIITLLPTAHNYSAIISTMAGLLVLDLKSRLVAGQTYSCQFTLRSPQHPFITVLEKSADAAEDVLTQMHALCTHPDYTVSSNSLELLRAVFLWLSSHPQRGGDARPWRLLLSLPQTSARERLLLDCLSWQQTTNPKLIESVFAAYAAVTETVIYQQQGETVTAILPVLARVSNELVRQGRDPRPCYSLMERAFALDVGAQRAAGLVIALLADNLAYTSALHLHELMNLCLSIISKYEYPSISLNIFVAFSLQWLHLPSSLTANALKVSAKIIEIHRSNIKQYNRLDMPNLLANKTFQTLLFTDGKLYQMFALFKTWERVRDNRDKLESWMDGIERVDPAVQLDMVGFLLGIVLERRNEDYFADLALRCLQIVAKLVDVRKDLAVQLLPVLLFKMAEDHSPAMKMECLKAVPLMAKTKENVPTIVAILAKLKATKSIPTSFLIHLHSTLTGTQVRCFRYLQETLLEPARPDELKWELELARAKAVRDICESRPPQGLELVSIISSILNRCTDVPTSLAAAQALQGLQRLWRHRLVAPPSAWAALQQKLGRDRRPAVQISICNLLAEVPALRVSTAEYDKLIVSGASWLWRHLAEGGRDVIAAAACALHHYGLDYPLAVVPEIYRKTVQLPASFCKTPADAARKPEDVLDYIPCEIWPEVFKFTNHDALESVRHLAEKLIEIEIRAYRSGVYQPTGKGEPHGYDYLPNTSVLRGLGDYLRKQATKPSYDCPEVVLLEILLTLSAEYPKPLPPLELCFVHELFHRGRQWRKPCLTLAARQAATSGSAKRFVENYLMSAEPGTLEESDIQTIFELLPQLCRTLPPNSLRGPIEKSLTTSYSKVANTKAKDHKGDVKGLAFVKQLDLIAEALESEKIHDANRTLLSQIVENYMAVIADDNVVFPAYTRVCRHLSTAHLERMTSPSSWWETSGPLLRSATAIRCEVARHAGDAGLVWLNEIIDAAADFAPEQEYSLRSMSGVLQVARPCDATRDWLLQLMARAQVAFTEKDNPSAQAYIWDVFVLSAVYISGHWSFEPDADKLPSSKEMRHAMFPAAVAGLFAREGWTEHAQKVIECLCHTRSVHNDVTAAVACQKALLALKASLLTTCLWAKAVWNNRTYD